MDNLQDWVLAELAPRPRPLGVVGPLLCVMVIFAYLGLLFVQLPATLEIFHRRRMPGPPGATLHQLVSRWGAPDDIFTSSDEIYPSYEFWTESHVVQRQDLPAVEGRAFGYDLGMYKAIVVFISRDGRVTAVYQAGT